MDTGTWKKRLMLEPTLTPKKRKTRQRILEVATKIFAAEGYRQADVQVIADSAAVGKGTIYRHFGNKEQLFLAVAKFNLDQLSEYVTAQLVDVEGVVNVLRTIAIACARFYQKHPECVEIMIQERAEFREAIFPTHLMRRAETRSELEALIQRGIDAGEIRSLRPAEVVDAFSDMLYGVIVCGCIGGARKKLVQRAERSIEYFLTGICPAFEVKRSKS
jgi:AcrR family transcriptional regulator